MKTLNDSPDTQINSSGGDGAPRWVKVFGAIIVLFIVIFAALHLAGLGLHQHRTSEHNSNHTTP